MAFTNKKGKTIQFWTVKASEDSLLALCFINYAEFTHSIFPSFYEKMSLCNRRENCHLTAELSVVFAELCKKSES